MTTINPMLDSKLSDLMRLSRDKAGAGELTEKIGRGREQMSELGTQVSNLKAALGRLAAPSTQTYRWVEQMKVTARSKEMGLTYDSQVPANDDRNKPLADVARFSGVSAGTVRINTVSIAIDPAVDSLNDIMARINASSAGVAASIDPATDRLAIASNTERKPLLLDNNGTGFFSAAGLAPRAYAPTRGEATGFAEPEKLIKDIGEVVKAVNGILSGKFADLDSETIDQLKTGLKEALVKGLGGNASNGTRVHIRSKYGFEIDFTSFSEEKALFGAKSFSAKALEDFAGTYAFLAGKPEEGVDGLAKTLNSAFNDSLNGILTTLGTKFAQGIMVDMKA